MKNQSEYKSNVLSTFISPSYQDFGFFNKFTKILYFFNTKMPLQISLSNCKETDIYIIHIKVQIEQKNFHLIPLDCKMKVTDP